MIHSVKEIGFSHALLSDKRKDEKRFVADDFFTFAQKNKERFSLIERGDDLLVSTWFVDELVDGYKKTL